MSRAWLLLLSVLISCGSNSEYVPKPHAFPRMELPEKKYIIFDSAHIPYKFEIPVYARMEKDTNLVYTENPGWYNLNFHDLGATLHLTYYRFNNWPFYDSLVYDSRKLVNKHLQRADDILEIPVSKINPALHGVIFQIEGNTATNFNFYVTDSAKHFLRGALYFNNRTNSDSIAPAVEFIKRDAEHLIKSITWKN